MPPVAEAAAGTGCRPLTHRLRLLFTTVKRKSVCVMPMLKRTPDILRTAASHPVGGRCEMPWFVTRHPPQRLP